MSFKHELESYCFVDENGIEKSFDFGCPAAGEFIVDTTNFSYNSNYGQLLFEQINQLHQNNQKLIEIERQYKLCINSLIETLQKRDRTLIELEMKLNKNATNLLKLQQFLQKKLNEMEIYKQKYVREKLLNQEHYRRSKIHKVTLSDSLHFDENDKLDDHDIIRDSGGICLVCEQKYSIPSNWIGYDDENCCGIVIDESLDEL